MNNATNPFAPPQAIVADLPSSHGASAPPLWNPNAAANWSLLLSPVFGAFLHMKNWQALGETSKAASARTWFVATLLVMVALMVAAVLMPHSAVSSLSRAAGFGLLLAWYFGSGRAQAQYVKERFGKDYPRKGWLVPLALALVIFVGLVFVLTAVVLAAAGVFR